MKKTLALLLLTTIAFSACKKDTPKETPQENLVEQLPGKVYGAKEPYYVDGLQLYSITFYEFKSNNEFMFYRRISYGDLKTPGKWESLGNDAIRIKRGQSSDDLIGEIKGDTIIMRYKNEVTSKYILVKDFKEESDSLGLGLKQ